MIDSKGARRPPVGRAQHHGDGGTKDGKEPQSLVTEDGKFFISSSVQRGWRGDSRFSWSLEKTHFPSDISSKTFNWALFVTFKSSVTFSM